MVKIEETNNRMLGPSAIPTNGNIGDIIVKGADRGESSTGN